VEELALEEKKTTESDVMIARRLETMLRVTREDEARLLEIFKVRRLERRTKNFPRSK
jgi:hypothetical protein